MTEHNCVIRQNYALIIHLHAMAHSKKLKRKKFVPDEVDLLVSACQQTPSHLASTSPTVIQTENNIQFCLSDLFSYVASGSSD